jgi:hypothetical protein
MSIESNCFRINGLESLLIEYRRFRITGLRRESPEYYSNLQRMVRQLSFQMRAPVTTHDVDGETFLVLPTGFGNPPDHVALVGTLVSLKDTGGTIALEFGADSPELDGVRLRFLQFAFQNPLWNDPQLWQPGAGKPFFFRKPERQLGSIDLFEGFAMRVAPHPEGGFGVIVDLRRKLVSRSSLVADVSREEVNRIRGRSCLYKMGRTWFEVSVSGRADQNVGEPSIKLDGKPISLVDYLHRQSPKPVPPAIANLQPDGAAIYYRTTGPMQKAAPAQLCYLVEDTHGRDGARHQQETVIEPYKRHGQISRIVKKFLQEVKIGNTTVSVSHRPGMVAEKPFAAPALRFGNGTTLELDTNESRIKATNEYGRQRLSLLTDRDAGFFVRSLLDRQYLVLPKSIANSSGDQFRLDLKAQIEALFPDGGDYDPEAIEYDDLNGPRDFVGQSRAIRAAMQATRVRPGCALVMVHRYSRRARTTDQLAAWTVKELADKFGLTASVIHTDVIRKAYGSVSRNGETQYVVKQSERRRLSGYLRNVALNKVLLTNGKWPFVLETPLNADVVIGIDVKNNTAAFTLIANGGKIIRFATSASQQKEQLLKDQVAKFVSEMVQKESEYLGGQPKRVVIHRDGRVWPCEVDGLRAACERLASEGAISADWELTVVEISKSAPAPLRLFYVQPPRKGHGPFVDNPIVGTWSRATEDEGYVCTTGKPFRIPGTANPLHVRRAVGPMPIDQCISDVFALSCLTWTRPEGAMRLPISIKLCDRSLFDEAGDIDDDAIEFANTDTAGGRR